MAWPLVLGDVQRGTLQSVYEAGASMPIDSSQRAGTCCRGPLRGARSRRCGVVRSIAPSARSGAPTARSRASAHVDAVVGEIVDLRRRGFRFVALADDNFYR